MSVLTNTRVNKNKNRDVIDNIPEVKYAMRHDFVICALCLFVAISALEPVCGLTVSGGRFVEDVSPGDHINHVMTVSVDESDEPIDATAKLFGCGMDLKGMRQVLMPEDDVSPYSATSFLKVTPERVSLEPGKPVKIVLEGDVPENVGSGGRYAIVIIGTTPKDSGFVGVGFSTAVEVPVYLTIDGTELIETGDITELDVSSDIVSVIFENTGNHNYKATAEAVLKDESSEVVASASTPSDLESSNSMIPTTSRLFEIDLAPETDLSPGTYTVEVSVIHEDGTVLDTEETTFEV
jgi:hypothetical protein